VVSLWSQRPLPKAKKVILDEVDRGLVTRYRVLVGNPSDAPDAPAGMRARERFSV
jgi:hypothetical protein